MSRAKRSSSERAASVLRRSRKRYLGSRYERGESVLVINHVSSIEDDVLAILSAFSYVCNRMAGIVVPKPTRDIAPGVVTAVDCNVFPYPLSKMYDIIGRAYAIYNSISNHLK